MTNNNKPLLEVKNLKAAINTNEILKNLNLKVYKGEIHEIGRASCRERVC